MLVLDATTKTIKVNMTGAAATTNPDFAVAYADNTGSAFTEGAQDGTLNGVTDVTVVSAPGASTRRVIKDIRIENRDTAPVTLNIKYDNNATQRTIARVTLEVGDTWTLAGVYNTNGGLKSSAVTAGDTLTTEGALINSATSKATPVDADYVGLMDSAASNILKKLSWANIKTNFDAAGAGLLAATGILTYGASVTTDPAIGSQYITLTGNPTITFGSLTAGQVYRLVLLQDGTGSRTVTWGSTIKWIGGTAPTLTTTANKADIVTYTIINSIIYADCVKNA